MTGAQQLEVIKALDERVVLVRKVPNGVGGRLNVEVWKECVGHFQVITIGEYGRKFYDTKQSLLEE